MGTVIAGESPSSVNFLNRLWNMIKNILTVSTLAFAALFLIACSDYKAAAPAAPAEKQGSTAVSLDTGEGSFSFKSDSDGDSTAVSVDTDSDGGSNGNKK